MDFNINYSLTQKDYFKFNLRNIKKQSIIYSILVVILAFVIRLYANDMNMESLKDLTFWLQYILYVIIGIAIVVLYLVLMVYISSKIVFKTNKETYQNLNFRFTDDGIHQIIQEKEYITKWTDFSKCHVFLGIYCFMISDRQGVIIPKKEFSSEQQSWLNQKLK